MESLEDRANKLRDELIGKRQTIESEISNFRNRLKMVPPHYLGGIDIERLDAKELVPALYREPFDISAYRAQLQEVLGIFDQVDCKRNELIDEALKEKRANEV